MNSYDPKDIEKKWQDEWRKSDLYKTSDTILSSDTKKKCYVLDMFPYPSGEGLHVGHPKGYIATDIYSRHKRMIGHAVLHPMGWDAFGLPAENFAIKNKVHPRVAVDKNVAHFKEQLGKIGFDYDWNRETNTTDPKFYRWTQWIFLKLLEKGLAYQSFEPINWCPSCQTGLANEDLDGNTCERCGTVVEKKPMRQWVLKITDYAEKLLADLDTLNWPESIKESQRNWIGKSEGAIIKFPISNSQFSIEVFTTRADTLFGCTYVVLAPEHPLIETLKNEVQNQDEVVRYIVQTKNKSEIERVAEGKEKTGVELKGVVATNPANGEEVPVFIADYVLAHYGTGAIMAVPAHDERDFEFAKKFNLPIVQVVCQYYPEPKCPILENAYIGNGSLVESGQFDGMGSETAKRAITEFVGGEMKTTYKLRDWVFSRQRYWGEPIPVVHCEKCGVVPVPEKDLPVILPEVEQYEPTGTGESPLADISEWVNTMCPKCGGPAKRETNTMPQWAGSSWYYLRYIDPHNETALVDKEKEKYWSPVDMYVGGAEHATRHLIYARFWHKFLYDIGAVNYPEPFLRLQHVGLIQASDGRKMSKRYGNVINPDDIIATYGADTLRVYEMFMGPFDQTVSWSEESIIGSRRFLEKVWRLKDNIRPTTSNQQQEKKVETLLHKTIKKVGEDIEMFRFNTAISAMMIFVNAAEKEGVAKEQYETFLKLLAPFAPHIAEELWHALGHDTSIHLEEFPVANEVLIVDEAKVVAVQIDGKTRDTFTVPSGMDDEAIQAEALAREKIKKWLDGRTVSRVIIVKGKIVSIVTMT